MSNLILTYILILISPLLLTFNLKNYNYIAGAQQSTFMAFILTPTMLTIASCFMFFMTFEFAFLNTSIEFSITRKSFYIAVQILKIIFSITLTIIYTAFINVIGLIFNSVEIAKSFINIFFLFVLVFVFIATLGEFCGVIINTIGKLIVFSILFCLIMIFAIPIFMSILINIKSLNKVYLYIIGTILLIISSFFCSFNWLAIRTHCLK